jgi:N-acetyldiaminopimelate deacetylase
VHTSILYSFLEEVLKKKQDQNILFLFQPAEEAGGGAMEFYNTGVFDQFQIKNAYALHVTDEYSLGTIASTSGVLFASALEVDIDFIGESAHVAFPREGKNAFIALRNFLDACDKLLSEISEPLLFGIGKINSGFIRNIAPGTARLEGSIRGLSEQKVNEFTQKLKNELEQIKNKTGVDYKFTKGAHYPELIVNNELYKKYSKLLANKFIFKDCGHKMTGEDFGFFSQKWQSFMFWLGTSKGEKYGLHNPKFLPPDEVIVVGKDIFMEIVNDIS